MASLFISLAGNGGVAAVVLVIEDKCERIVACGLNGLACCFSLGSMLVIPREGRFNSRPEFSFSSSWNKDSVEFCANRLTP